MSDLREEEINIGVSLVFGLEKKLRSTVEAGAFVFLHRSCNCLNTGDAALHQRQTSEQGEQVCITVF